MAQQTSLVSSENILITIKFMEDIPTFPEITTAKSICKLTPSHFNNK